MGVYFFEIRTLSLTLNTWSLLTRAASIIESLQYLDSFHQIIWNASQKRYIDISRLLISFLSKRFMQLFIKIFVQCYACPSINILGFDDFLQLAKDVEFFIAWENSNDWIFYIHWDIWNSYYYSLFLSDWILELVLALIIHSHSMFKSL